MNVDYNLIAFHNGTKRLKITLLANLRGGYFVVNFFYQEEET